MQCERTLTVQRKCAFTFQSHWIVALYRLISRYMYFSPIQYALFSDRLAQSEMYIPDLYLRRDIRFQTMWYVRPAKPQISLRIRAV